MRMTLLIRSTFLSLPGTILRIPIRSVRVTFSPSADTLHTREQTRFCLPSLISYASERHMVVRSFLPVMPVWQARGLFRACRCRGQMHAAPRPEPRPPRPCPHLPARGRCRAARRRGGGCGRAYSSAAPALPQGSSAYRRCARGCAGGSDVHGRDRVHVRAWETLLSEVGQGRRAEKSPCSEWIIKSLSYPLVRINNFLPPYVIKDL